MTPLCSTSKRKDEALYENLWKMHPRPAGRCRPAVLHRQNESARRSARIPGAPSGLTPGAAAAKKRPAHRSGVRPAVRGALLGHLWYFPPWLMENARYSCSHSITRASCPQARGTSRSRTPRPPRRCPRARPDTRPAPRWFFVFLRRTAPPGCCPWARPSEWRAPLFPAPCR